MTSVPVLLVRWASPLLGCALLAGALTAIIVSRLPAGVDVQQTFTIPVPQRPSTGEYEFDGYYALQATDLFAETLAGWLALPDLVAEAYRRAGLPEPASSVRKLARVFTARKLSGQLVELRFHARTEEEARALSREISELLRNRIEAFNAEGRSSLAFSVTAGDPLIIPVQRNALLRAAVAAFVTAVVLFNGILLWDMGVFSGRAETKENIS